MLNTNCAGLFSSSGNFSLWPSICLPSHMSIVIFPFSACPHCKRRSDLRPSSLPFSINSAHLLSSVSTEHPHIAEISFIVQWILARPSINLRSRGIEFGVGLSHIVLRCRILRSLLIRLISFNYSSLRVYLSMGFIKCLF